MKEYKKLTLFLICIVLLKIAFAFLADNHTYFSLRDFFTSILNTENIVSLTNESRRAVGLNALKVNSKLESAAQKKAEDMLKNQYFSHTSPTGEVAWNFMDDAGYAYLFAGENLAINFISAEEVTAGWLASITHKENILSDKFTQIGIGVTTGKFLGADSTIVVQMFGKPLRSSALINVINQTVKKSKKITHSKRPVRLAVRTTDSPTVKDIPIKRYISKLVQNNAAQWFPLARTHEMYALIDKGIPTKNLLDMFFVYIVVSGICIIAFRYIKKRQFQNKFLTVVTIFVIGLSALLATF